MNENNNNNVNNAEETVEQIEITKTNVTVPFSARVLEADKKIFKEVMEGTDSEKLRRLIQAYEKQKESEDSFTLNKEITYIQRAVDTIVSNLNAINRNVNEHEVYLQEKYTNGFGEELREIESRLVGEEVLQVRIVNLENSNQNLLDSKEKSEIKISELNEKITGLEEENTKYIALNSEIVARENSYINQMREKDTLLAEKELQLRDLETENNKKLEELEENYKKQLQELQNNLEQANKKYSDSMAEASREKAVLETKVDNLEGNIKDLKAEKDVLKANLKEVREQCKQELNSKEIEHKQEIKDVEDKFNIEKENLNNNLKEAQEQHKTELKAIREEHKKELEILEDKVGEAQKEANKTEIQLAKLETKLEAKTESESNLKAELKAVKEKLRKEEELNKKLEEEIEDK